MNNEDLVIGVPREINERCRCVGLVTQSVQALRRKGRRVLVERSAGQKAYCSDELYEQAGAELVGGPEELYRRADVVIKLRVPQLNETVKKHELDLMKKGAAIISFLSPTLEPAIVQKLTAGGLTGFAMELLPRISRAQSMDALSTLSTIAGYRAVLLAANLLGKFFPLLMTAAGTIKPANLLVIGAGVAGLQAIAGGLPKIDVVITTALVYGRRAPLIVTAEMVKLMPPGSVIVDIAAESGGNCELTQAGQTIERHGVTIHGAVELPSQMPLHTSLMYSKNALAAFGNLFAAEDDRVDLEDEINRDALVTYKGRIVSEAVSRVEQKGGEA